MNSKMLFPVQAGVLRVEDFPICNDGWWQCEDGKFRFNLNLDK